GLSIRQLLSLVARAISAGPPRITRHAASPSLHHSQAALLFQFVFPHWSVINLMRVKTEVESVPRSAFTPDVFKFLDQAAETLDEGQKCPGIDLCRLDLPIHVIGIVSRQKTDVCRKIVAKKGEDLSIDALDGPFGRADVEHGCDRLIIFFDDAPNISLF